MHLLTKKYYPSFTKKRFILLLLLILFISGTAFAKEPKKVLLISSYHPGFPTFFQQINGVKTLLDVEDITLDIEFMDTKRFPERENWNNFERMLVYKLKKKKSYDVILVADDNAFLFALKRQNNLFKDKPIVFFGVNNVELAIKQNNNSNVTGVVEAVSMKATIELMIRTRPKAKKIIAIVDNTPSGQGDLKKFYQLSNAFKSHSFSDISSSDMTWSEFYNQLKRIDKDEAVLLLSSYRDRNNKTLLFTKSLRAIKRNLKAPLFHLWFHGIGDGILGGDVINHFEQGKAAGKIALQILDGNPISKIKVVEKSPNQFVFDYNQIQKHTLSQSLFPENSLFLNKPTSVYEEHKTIIWAIIIAFTILTTALFTAINNIIRRKRVETKLRISEIKHKEMIANISDVISILDPKGRILYKSPNIEKLFGWTQEEMIGKNGLETVHPDDYRRIQNIFFNLIEDDRSVEDVEYRYRCKDGSYKWIELTAVNLLSDTVVEGVLLNYCDITERKKAEQILISERDMLETVTQSAGVGLAVISKDYRTHWANKVIHDIFGDVDGKLCYQTYNKSDKICSNCGVRKVFNQGEAYVVCEQKGEDANGNTIWSQIVATPIQDEFGNITSALEVVIPITERKLLEDQLRQSQKMESIGTITGGVAHDFNNILGVIIGNTEIALCETHGTSSLNQHLNEIKSASMKAVNIVKQLLSFSRKTDHKLIPVEMLQIIKESLSFLRSTIPATVEIVEHLPKEEQTILADPVQINQVILNLCINSSQAMDEAGTITLSAERISFDEVSIANYPELEKDKHYLKITVEDTGPGIAPEIIKNIFDPYFTTKDVGKGSGMGLAIVHGIVKNHNGTVTVDSKQGEGSVFSVLFPLADDIKMIEEEDVESVPHGTETILLVDDEEPIIKMTKQMLTLLGYKVYTKTNPIEALEFFSLKPGHFDLVITDMTMPQMTGIQLSEKLLEIKKDLPVIICTGYSSQISEEKAEEIGIAAYIMKPVITKEIAITIRNVLDT